VKIDGKHDLEEFSLAFQVMISRLQDMDVCAVQNVSLYFEPLDRNGARASSGTQNAWESEPTSSPMTPH
jgi:hypothetical protein